jgi:2-polyprenyl-3-methyl-5-hydroxy-6-metoxy-1,4-benzoquinol methylase
MFRVPKNTEQQGRDFYQNRYRQGFTTDCPNDQELSRFFESSFRGSEKDYTTYIGIIRAAGLRPGQIIYDFGCSWGYGSWQFAQAGFRVYSYEVSSRRARYAAEKLDCKILSEKEEIQEKADCFFSAHVIEHLPNPKMLWEKASRVLKPNGFVVLFMPNGEPSRAAIDRNYHKLWGHVHPLLLSADALGIMARQYGFAGYACSSPYNLQDIAASRLPGSLIGDELLFIARAS